MWVCSLIVYLLLRSKWIFLYFWFFCRLFHGVCDSFCFDTWLWSKEAQHCGWTHAPLPHNSLRGHEKHHRTSKQPTHSPPHHPTWHVRDKHWPQQWFSHFDGKMPECLFTSGSLRACCVCCGVWSHSGTVVMQCPAWGAWRETGILAALVLETHGQNQSQRFWSGRAFDFNGRGGWACSCTVAFVTGPI